MEENSIKYVYSRVRLLNHVTGHQENEIYFWYGSHVNHWFVNVSHYKLTMKPYLFQVSNKSLERSFYIKNKFCDFCWKRSSLTSQELHRQWVMLVTRTARSLQEPNHASPAKRVRLRHPWMATFSVRSCKTFFESHLL